MIIYGINPVLEAIKSGRAKEVLVAQRADDRLQKLLEEAARNSVRVRFVTRDELEHAAKGGVHQGVVANVERRTEATLEELADGEERPAAHRGARRGRGSAERRRDPEER